MAIARRDLQSDGDCGGSGGRGATRSICSAGSDATEGAALTVRPCRRRCMLSAGAMALSPTASSPDCRVTPDRQAPRRRGRLSALRRQRPARLGRRPRHGSYAVHGTDVSKYQTSIAWHDAKASRHLLRLHQGDRRRRPRRRQFRTSTGADAKAAGVPRGAYHFYYFCRPAAEQARWFIRQRAARPLGAAAGARHGMEPALADLQAEARRRHGAQRDEASS